jgi:hypothetical protein
VELIRARKDGSRVVFRRNKWNIESIKYLFVKSSCVFIVRYNYIIVFYAWWMKRISNSIFLFPLMADKRRKYHEISLERLSNSSSFKLEFLQKWGEKFPRVIWWEIHHLYMGRFPWKSSDFSSNFSRPKFLHIFSSAFHTPSVKNDKV